MSDAEAKTGAAFVVDGRRQAQPAHRNSTMNLRFATLLSTCQSGRAIVGVLAVALGLALGMPVQAQSNAPLPIQPMTSIGADGSGYLDV